MYCFHAVEVDRTEAAAEAEEEEEEEESAIDDRAGGLFPPPSLPPSTFEFNRSFRKSEEEATEEEAASPLRAPAAAAVETLSLLKRRFPLISVGGSRPAEEREHREGGVGGTVSSSVADTPASLPADILYFSGEAEEEEVEE